jgi:myo-inositol-1(or 4)-monophosphatase
MTPTLNDLKALAHGAGEILRAGFMQPKHLELKREIDVVTETDKKSEAFLLEQVNAKFPGHHIVAEESGENEGDREHTWYIDPLDGTSNFAANLPIFAVSIAYAQQGEVTLGVVYDPIRDELFAAERGRGATLNEQPVHTNSQSELRRSMIVTGFPYDRFDSPVNNLAYFNAFALKVRSIRRLGSAAMDLCYIGAGRMDGYWELKMETWDLAAGVLIAREGGARVTTMDNHPDMLTPPLSVMAANPALHAEMLKVIEEVTAIPENQPYRDFFAG